MANQKKIKELWKRKDDYISDRLQMLTRKVDRAQASFLNTLVADYMGGFDVDAAGNLLPSTKNMRMAIRLDRLFDSLDSDTLRAINTQFGKDMLKLTPLSGRYYTAMGEPADRVKSIGEKVGFIEQGIGIKGDEIIKGGYLDTLSKVPEVRQQLKDYVISSVANKKGYSEYLRGMKELVVGAGQKAGILERYYRQFAYDTFNQTDAAINKHYADSLDLKWFVYTGSIIDSTRPFCRKRAGKTYNTEEAEKWKCDPDLIAKPKGKKCDDSYNPLIERGRYNCRHTIRYITEELACNNGRKEACEEPVKEKPTVKEVPAKKSVKQQTGVPISENYDEAMKNQDEWIKKLDKDEKDILLQYTRGKDKEINDGLRFGKGSINKEQVDRLSEILAKAPKFKGEVYRGIEIKNLDEFNNIVSNLKVGDVFVDKGFMSTSFDEGVAQAFTNWTSMDSKKIIYKIRSKTGVPIEKLSKFMDEKEILFNKNSKFRIVSFENKLIEGSQFGEQYIEIILSEL